MQTGAYKIRWIRSQSFEGYSARAGMFGFEIRKQDQSRPADDRWRLYVYRRDDLAERLWCLSFGKLESAKEKAKDVLRRQADFLTGDWIYQQRKAEARARAFEQHIAAHP